ncbi:MAG: DUF4252 domain-containing protein [Prevotellaceae bacterium]|jgi:hypothetical protein|nr:DUF4252 domain-containing protein [Prevotellaceae bacterium]
MKKITILVVTLLMMAMTAQAQGIEKLINKYSNDEHIHYVSLSADLIQFGLSFIDDKAGEIDHLMREALSKIKGLKVLTLKSESESESLAEKKLMESITNELNSILQKDSKAEPVIESREKGNITKIYTTSEGLLIMTKEPGELSVVFISGELSKKAINEIISQTDKK